VALLFLSFYFDATHLYLLHIILPNGIAAMTVLRIILPMRIDITPA